METLNNTEAQQSSRKLDISKVIEAAEELNELLDLETQYLKKMDIEAVKSISQKKMKLIRQLELMKEIVSKHPDILTGKSPEVKEYILNLDKQMQETMRANFKQITSAREINKRVMEAISFSVSQFERRASSYNGKGEDISGDVTKAQVLSSAAGVAVNQSV